MLKYIGKGFEKFFSTDSEVADLLSRGVNVALRRKLYPRLTGYSTDFCKAVGQYIRGEDMYDNGVSQRIKTCEGLVGNDKVVKAIHYKVKFREYARRWETPGWAETADEINKIAALFHEIYREASGLIALEEENKKLRAEKEKLKEENTVEAQKIADLTADKIKLNNEKAAEIQKVADLTEEKIRLTNEKAAEVEKVADLTADKIRLTNEKAAEMQKAARLLEKKNAKKEEIERLKGEKETLLQERNVIALHFRMTPEEILRLLQETEGVVSGRGGVGAVIRDFVEQTEQVDDKDRIIAELRMEVRDLEIRLAEANQIIAQQGQRIVYLEQEVQVLEGQLAEKNEALRIANERIAQQVQQLAVKDQQIFRLESEKNALASKNAILTVVKVINEQEITRLSKDNIALIRKSYALIFGRKAQSFRAPSPQAAKASSSSQAASSVPVVIRSTATQLFCRKMLSTCVQVKTDLETEVAGDFKQGALLLIRQIEAEIQEIDDSSLDACKARISGYLGAFWALAQASEDQKDLLESYIDTFKMDLR